MNEIGSTTKSYYDVGRRHSLISVDHWSMFPLVHFPFDHFSSPLYLFFTIAGVTLFKITGRCRCPESGLAATVE